MKMSTNFYCEFVDFSQKYFHLYFFLEERIHDFFNVTYIKAFIWEDEIENSQITYGGKMMCMKINRFTKIVCCCHIKNPLKKEEKLHNEAKIKLFKKWEQKDHWTKFSKTVRKSWNRLGTNFPVRKS